MINIKHINSIRKKYDPDDTYLWSLDVHDGELILEVSFLTADGQATIMMKASDIYAIRRKIAKKLEKLEKMIKVLEKNDDK